MRIIIDEKKEGNITSKPNYEYLEDSIKNYIKKTDFPKKLVQDKVKKEIKTKKELNQKLTNTIDKMNKDLETINKKLRIIKNENSNDIEKLLTYFSNVGF